MKEARRFIKKWSNCEPQMSANHIYEYQLMKNIYKIYKNIHLDTSVLLGYSLPFDDCYFDNSLGRRALLS